MIHRGRPIWNPAAYQSSGKKGAFFEGWYFKLISADRREALALIPGVSVSPSGNQAFLQIFDGSSLEYRFIPYPFESFKPGPSTFDIALAEHRFSEGGISLAHRDCSLFLDGSLRFGPLTPWPVKLFSPGAMGWYGLLPFMEDYHGVLNMDTSLEGELTVDGSRYNFDGGRCYIEKDWGSGFPSAWIWMQCNSFETPGVSVTFSLARIPWKKRWFSGFIIGVLFEGRLIPFCTYNGAKFQRLELTDSGGFCAHLQHGPYRLELEVQGGAKRALQAPLEGAMRSSVEESLSARCFMRFSCKKSGRSLAEDLLFQGEGERAGLEISGDMEPILRSLAVSNQDRV